MKRILIFMITFVLLFVYGCDNSDLGHGPIDHNPPMDNPGGNPEDNPVDNPIVQDPIIDPVYPSEEEPESYAMEIKEGGSYTLSGEINGVVFIDAGDGDVELILSGATIISKKILQFIVFPQMN